MPKSELFLLVTAALLISGPKAMALSFGSDSSLGGTAFTEALSGDGDFGLKNDKSIQTYGVWNVGYIFSRFVTNNSQGVQVVDESTELDLGAGEKKKSDFEFGGGLTFSNTPQENLKTDGLNIYYGGFIKFDKPTKVEGFVPSIELKLTLTEMVYLQTFSGTVVTRTGKSVPVSGLSGISQFATKIEGYFDFFEPVSFKLGYTTYKYNRNVPDFLNNLDNPRAVSINFLGLTSSVSGFYLNQTELDVNAFLDPWEFDFVGTIANSALDLSLTWTQKEEAWYDINKLWRVGAAFEYVDASTFTDHVYTASVKYEPN